MKTMLFLPAFMFLGITTPHAQVIKKLQKKVEQKVQQRVDQKVDNAINKGLDKSGDAVKNKPKDNDNSISDKGGKDQDNGKISADFKVNTKFDFVAGDKVIALDDFSRVNTGDFPSQWNTNGSGEVVTIEGKNGKWLEMRGKFTYYPEFIKSLPDNFTIEFDLIFNYALKKLERNILGFYFITADKATTADPVFRYGFNKPGKAGAAIEFHSYQPNTLEIFKWKNKVMDLNTMMTTTSGFIASMRNTPYHISIWRQKDRVRMYLNDQKIVDVPRLLQEAGKVNMFKIGFEDWEDAGRAYITNFRFAESTPDMRSTLLTNGKFVTSGIYFSSGSDKVKPVSYGILKEMAGILKSDPGIKLKIIGHTDSDGDAASNLTLSQKRAASVKVILVNDFDISSERLLTDGLGQTKPVSPNTSEEGKANNRRVEFIKM